MTPKPAPSERQPNETAVAFEAFRTYLEMGPTRSTAKVARALSKSKTLMTRWSKRNNWVERVRAFESDAASHADSAHVDAIAERSRRQAQIAQLHGEASAIVASEVVRRLSDPETRDAQLRGLSTRDLLALEATLGRMHNRAVMTERLALGLTTDQPGEPLPRAQAEEMARRLADDELDEKLAGVDELEVRREIKRRRKAKAS